MSTVTLDNKTILVTGAAGFIGSNLVKRIYQEAPSATVIGIDNMNAYYDVALKEFRLNELAKYPTFTFVKGNIADKELITELFEKYKPSVVVNLAAQAGVRYSITNRMLMWNLTWSAFSISLKPAAIARVWSIWCMLHLPPSTVPTRRFRTARMIRLTIRFPFMQLPRNPMS